MDFIEKSGCCFLLVKYAAQVCISLQVLLQPKPLCKCNFSLQHDPVWWEPTCVNKP